VHWRIFDEMSFSFDTMDQVWGRLIKDKGRVFITTKLTHSYISFLYGLMRRKKLTVLDATVF
jgi:hypothetical protein